MDLRIVNLTINVDMDRFGINIDAKREAFHQALGRMVSFAFGLAEDYKPCDVRGMVGIGKDLTDVEILCTYEMPSGSKFTMAAVARDNGTRYTYHS